MAATKFNRNSPRQNGGGKKQPAKQHDHNLGASCPATADETKRRQPNNENNNADDHNNNKLQLGAAVAKIRPVAVLANKRAPAAQSPQRASCATGKQLSLRAKSLAAKLLESHGAELRRTLFSLRQIFQDNAELATEFADSDGLDSLMRVAVDATDQIHQNYILRALGQLIAHPAGINALTRRNETIQWLYSLLGSQHQLVARTAIKLLLQFVGHGDTNCLHFCCAIKAVDGNRRATNRHQQDVGLLVDAMTLVNKTLAGIPDQDTFYDFVDPLEEAGMESIIDKCSKLDSQLREQFKLYEQALEAEDEDEDGEQAACGGSDCAQPATMDASNGQRAALPVANDNSNSDDCLDDEAHQRRKSKRAQRRDEEQQQQLRQSSRQSQSGQAIISAAASGRQPPATNTERGDFAPSESGGTATANSTNDDNYESANDESTSSEQQPQGKPKANNRLIQTVDTETQQQTRNRKHQLQLRQQPSLQYQRQQRSSNVAVAGSSGSSNSTKQNNLDRGKEQRASISSCSSSDSYASYGSGYASGSGNSTDHEHKQRIKQRQQQLQQQSTSATNAAASTSILSKQSEPFGLVKKANMCQKNEDDGEEDEEEDAMTADNGADDDDEDDGDNDRDLKLKQHISELEQLTDELAKRDIFCSQDKTSQLASNKHVSGSNASSILSTSSNISSLSSGIQPAAPVEAPLASAKTKQASFVAVTTPPKASPLPDRANNEDSRHNDEDRSATTTPVPCNQTAMSATPKKSHVRLQQDVGNSFLNAAAPDTEERHQTATALRQSRQFTTATTTIQSPTKLANQSTNSAPQAQKQQQQEPYYHNLFQWEQLVSKGVTRPLLINDLDFTDLRDDDDCDLLNTNNQNGGTKLGRINQSAGEPLSINIPHGQQAGQQLAHTDHDSVDSGASTGSPGSHSVGKVSAGTPVSAPPPLPPPPISPWFNTISNSRPQSQFMSTPSPPPYDFGQQVTGPGQLHHQDTFARDQSPANSTYSNYSRNSVCLSQQQHANSPAAVNQHFNTLQPVSNLRSASSMSSLLFGNNGKYANKRKKTMKLFWKEVREDRSLLAKLTKKKTIWDEIKPVHLDTQKLEYLFESKAKDLLLSKSRNGLDGPSQRKVKITVLDAKRSNAINIGMTKLPPMRTIKSAILKMDSSIMNREGIEKILTIMMPTEEEKSRIIEAQLANPDIPLGTAEQFLLNLASISALEARLKLWAFQLDYAQIEKEVAEPLMDLKQAIEEIERSETFRSILGTLLAIGNFLNSTNSKGFQIDYLEKVPEVKDTVHKHSLLHHLCLFVQEKFDPQLTGDLYSEFSAVNRASKVDYAEVAKNLKKMQQDCKSSWDYLKIVAKHDGLASLMNTCGVSSSSMSSTNQNSDFSSALNQSPKSSGKLNNLSKLSMITTVIENSNDSANQQQSSPSTKQLKIKVSDFLTDCAERIMVLMVIHRRVMNRFQKLLVYLGYPSHQIKQAQPQQILKIINEFALEYRTKRERVREMLMKKQQCQHHHHHHNHHAANRWQMSRMRWAGSQQLLGDSLGYNRPCSTNSSCASFYATGVAADTGNLSLNGCAECALESRHKSTEPQHNRQHQQHHHNNSGGGRAPHNRPNSPSCLSQISNYSDYLLDQSCCASRQESITPVPCDKGCLLTAAPGSGNKHLARRPHSMSVSMFDLQNNHQGHNTSGGGNNSLNSSGVANDAIDELALQKDEQMRRLLGAGKSLEIACNDLYQISNWSSTMTRVTRHPPSSQAAANKLRAASIDDTAQGSSPLFAKDRNSSLDEKSNMDLAGCGGQRQSSYYKHLHRNMSLPCEDELEQNSDEEILQSLVRAATTKSGHSGAANYKSQSGNRSTSSAASSATGYTPNSDKFAAKSKILNRFSCDRKSLRRSLGPGVEASNA